MNSIAAKEAKTRFGELLDRVLAGEQVAIKRNGRVVAIVVPPSTTSIDRADEVAEDAPRPFEFPAWVTNLAREMFPSGSCDAPLYTPEEVEGFLDREARNCGEQR